MSASAADVGHGIRTVWTRWPSTARAAAARSTPDRLSASGQAPTSGLRTEVPIRRVSSRLHPILAGTVPLPDRGAHSGDLAGDGHVVLGGNRDLRPVQTASEISLAVAPVTFTNRNRSEALRLSMGPTATARVG